MKRVCSTWIPHFLWSEEMKRRHSMCQENHLLSHVITVDKFWIHRDDPKTKCESEARLHSDKFIIKKVCQQKSVGKVMLVVFFDCREMVYQRVCPPKTLISKKQYSICRHAAQDEESKDSLMQEMRCRKGNVGTHSMQMPGVGKGKDTDFGLCKGESRTNKRRG